MISYAKPCCAFYTIRIKRYVIHKYYSVLDPVARGRLGAEEEPRNAYQESAFRFMSVHIGISQRHRCTGYGHGP